MYYYINGKFKLLEDANIPFDDAGFLYGDGLFETMRFDNKNISCFNNVNSISATIKHFQNCLDY